MEQSYSESDISLSPSQILERLQVLRQLQLLQRGKLQKQRLEYQETSENSSALTEIVSHFSTSTSYNTFRSLLESGNDSSNDATPRSVATSVSSKVKEKDLVDGVSILNLSQESEFIVYSPTSARSAISSKNEAQNPDAPDVKSTNKKHISLDDMPVLTPKKDFEALILEKLKSEVNRKVTEEVKKPVTTINAKKPFLRKGEGTSRFGVQKKDLVIQNTKSLPWRKNVKRNSNLSQDVKNVSANDRKTVDIEILVTDHDKTLQNVSKETEKSTHNNNNKRPNEVENSKISHQSKDSNVELSPNARPQNIVQTKTKDKHPLLSSKGKTWASVLTNDQNDFLRQLKQSDYYKNFTSPAKSTVSDASCDENLLKLRNEREMAEQNMFDLLESKVSHESFSLENSFFHRFLRRSQLECSGESTPLVLQQCLANNPDLRKLLPNILHRKRNEDTHTDVETNAECSDCCSETCSTVSSCCSCKTVEQNNSTYLDQEETPQNNKVKHVGKKVLIQNGAVDKAVKYDTEKKESDNVKEDTEMKANMVEMNAKLIATSELLKERLRELEDEIETFRKENAQLTKMREEIDAERHKFYEEKTMFEQKFNEEKILSEYYISEEKEKLTKQKQLYDKYVREMRGRLNRKDKDEVINLKKEISDLKEEIRLKDAKSTSTIARLRNQIKIFEKEKKDLQDEIEKLKKENRRIQHSNDMTRRMTNIKYLEEINKKLSNITAKETQSEIHLDSNAKYKAFEIERQSRPRKVQTTHNKPLRSRAKSVPNLKVTSRYAKYFSQRDVVSDMDKNNILNTDSAGGYTCSPDDDQSEDELRHVGDESEHCSDSEPEDNNLEKLYMERFHSMSPKSVRSNLSNSCGKLTSKSLQSGPSHHNHDDFFISKSTSKNDCNLSNDVSPASTSSELNSYRSRCPASLASQRSSDQRSPLNSSQELNNNKTNLDHFSTTSNASYKTHNLSKSPVSILTNRSSNSHKPTTVVHKDYMTDTFNVTPEPATSRSSTSKTNLNPTEIRKPDGSKELRFPNGNVKFVSPDGQYSKFVYYNGDVKENFYNEGRIKYFYAETKTCHTTHADGLEVLEFPDGQVEKRYKDGSSEIRLPNGSVRYFDPKNEHVREEWRFPDGTAITVSASGEQRIVFSNGQVEVHAKDHKRREFPDGTVKLVYNDGTSETRYASGRVRIKDKHGNLIMDSATR